MCEESQKQLLLRSICPATFVAAGTLRSMLLTPCVLTNAEADGRGLLNCARSARTLIGIFAAELGRWMDLRFNDGME